MELNVERPISVQQIPHIHIQTEQTENYTNFDLLNKQYANAQLQEPKEVKENSIVLVRNIGNEPKREPLKIADRATKFANYNIFDKIIDLHEKARVTMLIAKDIKFTRENDLEDKENPMIVIKIRSF